MAKRTSFNLIFLFLSSLVIGVLTEHLLGVTQLLTDSLSSNLSAEDIEEVIQIKEKWSWLGYILNLVILLIKIILISAVLYFGTFLFNKRISYRDLFGIVGKAELLFLLVGIIKLGWFYLFNSDYDLQDLHYFYPLSALSFVGYDNLDPWFIYPFQVLNFFELAYWFLLSYLLGKKLKITTDKGFRIVASSYGPALLLWVVAAMFLTLNFS